MRMRPTLVLVVFAIACLPALAGDAQSALPTLYECLPDGTEAPVTVPETAAKGGKGGGSGGCCDPALEPGTNGLPFCFEGHTCCDSGSWQCNNPDGSPSCNAGEVCDGSCGSRGDTCNANSDCCSGKCKGGRCR